MNLTDRTGPRSRLLRTRARQAQADGSYKINRHQYFHPSARRADLAETSVHLVLARYRGPVTPPGHPRGLFCFVSWCPEECCRDPRKRPSHSGPRTPTASPCGSIEAQEWASTAIPTWPRDETTTGRRSGWSSRKTAQSTPMFTMDEQARSGMQACRGPRSPRSA